MSKIHRNEPGYGSRNRNKLPFIATAATVGLTAIVGVFGGKRSQDETPAPKPTVNEVVVDTTIAIPDKPGEGVQSLVQEEIATSGAVVDWDETQRLVAEARKLNNGEPRLGEPYALVDVPNVVASSGSDPTTLVP